jgi:diaminopimelate decarboxylase
MKPQENITYVNNTMLVEETSLNQIAQQVETPFYCYSSTAIENNYLAYKQAFSNQNTLICYAAKANSNQAVLNTLAKLGSGADVVSEGEIRRAIAAGIEPAKIVYSGVAKKEREIAYALTHNIFQFNVESEPEVQSISKVATKLGITANIAFRINPDVSANTHAKITTGKAENKFGIPISRAREIYLKASQLPGIHIQGVDVHIGSQILDIEPFGLAFEKIASLVETLKEDGHNITVIDIGGGLGIKYSEEETKPDVNAYAKLAEQHLSQLNCTIIVEPGRSIIGNAGVLVTEVVYIKKGENREFLILDAAMNDLIRPSMYEAYHDILPLNISDKTNTTYDIVGPVCETGDTFGKDRIITQCKAGDLVAIMSCGAYGSVMSSTYNTRMLAPEVLVKKDQFAVIRKRLSYDDVIDLDTVPNWD